MRVETDNALVYDGDDPLCFFILAATQGMDFAFVQCLDVGWEGGQRNPKRYWGRWDPGNAEGSLKAIMERGRKWPVLPEPTGD